MVESYKPQELAAITQALKIMESVRDPQAYVFLLETQIGLMFGAFYPQSIERILREMRSNKYLAAISMDQLREKIVPTLTAVLPQTDWRAYDYGLSVAIATSPRAFKSALTQTQATDYDQNFNLLPGTGFVIDKPPGIEQQMTLMDYLKSQTRFGIVQYASNRQRNIRRRSGF